MKVYLLMFLTVFFVSVDAFAQTEQTRSLVTTTGESTVYLSPNVAHITVTPYQVSKEYGAALIEIDKKIEKYRTKFNAFGAEHVAVSLPQVTPYSNQFTVSKILVVKVRDLNAVANFVEFLGERNERFTIAFSNDDLGRFQRQAQQEAMKNARNDASQLAQISGAKLGPVFQIDVSKHGPATVSYIFGPETPKEQGFAIGTLSIRSKVSAKFNLVPKTALTRK